MVLMADRWLRSVWIVALCTASGCASAGGNDVTTDALDDTTAAPPETSSTSNGDGTGSDPEMSTSSSGGEDDSTGAASTGSTSDASSSSETDASDTLASTDESSSDATTSAPPEPDDGSSSGVGSTGAEEDSEGGTTEVHPCDRPRTLKEAGACVGFRKGGSGVRIGAAVAHHWLVADSAYRELLVREFDSLTAENEMKWGPLQPERGSWYFDTADALVDFAEEQDMMIRGHTLVWYSQKPNWVDDIQNVEEFRDVMRDHVETTLDHYRGRVHRWDVVNEAMADGIDWNGTYLRDWRATQLLGADYIAEAFQMAHDADPDVELYYNDYNNDMAGAKADQVYALVADLVERGIPIDGVGFQLHVNATPTQIAQGGMWASLYPNYYNSGAFADNIDRYAALGLKVNITEFDVRVRSPFHENEAPPDAPRSSEPITAAEARLQAKVYYEYVSTCVEKYPTCDAITFWGVADPYSWYATDPVLPFDGNYLPKPAYDAIMAALQGVPYVAPQ